MGQPDVHIFDAVTLLYVWQRVVIIILNITHSPVVSSGRVDSLLEILVVSSAEGTVVPSGVNMKWILGLLLKLILPCCSLISHLFCIVFHFFLFNSPLPTFAHKIYTVFKIIVYDPLFIECILAFHLFMYP